MGSAEERQRLATYYRNRMVWKQPQVTLGLAARRILPPGASTIPSRNRLRTKPASPLLPDQRLQRIHDQVAKLRMIELRCHGVAELGLLARRAAEMVHAVHLLEIADGYALNRAAGGFDTDVGFLGGEDASVDYRRDARGRRAWAVKLQYPSDPEPSRSPGRPGSAIAPRGCTDGLIGIAAPRICAKAAARPTKGRHQ